MGHRSRRRHARCGEADVSLSEVFFSESSPGSSEPGVDRKSKQVCREVFRVLAQAEPGDPCLLGMSILEVVPAPDASRLAVRVALAPGTDVKEAMAALTRWKGGLRGEIAQALQRKRTPELVFEPAGPDGPPPGEEDWP
jgi:ribosome-binding factor A